MSRFLGRTTTLNGRVTRVRVPGVPADFRVPRGWPQPTDKWVRDNAFWQPPPGWTPLPGAVAAPAHWQFWEPNKLWSRVMGAHLQSIAIWGRLSNICSFLWLISFVANPFLGYPPLLRIFAFAAGGASIALVIVHENLKAKASKRLIAQFAIVAQCGRQDRLTREYQRYLTAMA